jgi:chromosome condensin MukBEF ATPase and DNA-binding subunit MukB
MTSSDADKLEKYDAMEKNMSDLIAENTELKEKLEEYMMNAKDSENESRHEVGNIHEDIEEVNELKAKIAALYKQLDVEKTRAASKIIKLEDEIKALRDENDNYLMKISEITFDNARMTAELNELTKSVQEKTDLVLNQPKFTPNNNKPMVDNSSLGTPHRNPYNPYANNGYGTW